MMRAYNFDSKSLLSFPLCQRESGIRANIDNLLREQGASLGFERFTRGGVSQQAQQKVTQLIDRRHAMKHDFSINHV